MGVKLPRKTDKFQFNIVDEAKSNQRESTFFSISSVLLISNPIEYHMVLCKNTDKTRGVLCSFSQDSCHFPTQSQKHLSCVLRRFVLTSEAFFFLLGTVDKDLIFCYSGM